MPGVAFSVRDFKVESNDSNASYQHGYANTVTTNYASVNRQTVWLITDLKHFGGT